MAEKIITFSGKQYSGKDTAAKILLDEMKDFKRCAMGDIIKIEYGKQHNLTYEEIEANKTQYRQGLIDLGNWGRQQSPDYQIQKIIEQEKLLHNTNKKILLVSHSYNLYDSLKADGVNKNPECEYISFVYPDAYEFFENYFSGIKRITTVLDKIIEHGINNKSTNEKVKFLNAEK